MSRVVEPAPRWAMPVTLLLSLVGLGISIYLSITHFDKQLLLCSSTGTIDCGAVTTSAQSYFLGIPVAFLGVAQYLAMTALNSPWGWRSKSYAVHVARFVLSVVGMGFVLWLIAAELLIINHICLWCSGVHVISFVMLIVLTRVSPNQLGWSRSAS